MTDAVPAMGSNRPYLLRALNEWINDNGMTPYLLVDAGRDGVPARVTKNPGATGEESLPAKVTGFPCRSGDVIRIEAPNAAGYGDPLERDPALVLDDVLDGFTPRELAREAYGVVLTGEPLAVDLEATETLRAERQTAQTAR